MEKREIIKITNVSKTIKDKLIIDNLSLKVYEGDIYGFIGPNGAGKTTTIRMMLNLISPSQGVIELFGYDTKKDYKRAIENVSAIVENPALFENMTAYENLELMANYPPVLEDRSVIQEVLDLVGLRENSKDKVKTFSLGMKQRLGLAMALLKKPKLIILDEPTNGLDPYGIKQMAQIIQDISKKEKITFLISNHLIYYLQKFCNRIAILDKGKLILEDEVDNILKVNQGKDLEDVFFEITKGA
jgi:ABC-type multidrug transport system ATPase subunit